MPDTVPNSQNKGRVRSVRTTENITHVFARKRSIGQWNARERTLGRQQIEGRDGGFEFTTPEGTVPGQRTMNGSRIPPS